MTRYGAFLLGLLLLLRPLCGAQLQEAKPGLVELAADTFVSTFKALPEDRWVLAEFYAHWCPACRHFQPEYEKVAAFFAERGEQEPVVTVARLDCANHADMCTTFKIGGYPTMKLGTAADLAALAVDKLVDVRPASRSADGVVAFLSKQLDVKFDSASSGGSSLGSVKDAQAGSSGGGTSGGRVTSRKLDPGHKQGSTGAAAGATGGKEALEGHAHDALDVGGAGAVAGADLNDVEGATLESWQYIVDSPVLLRGAEARQGLKDWAGLLAESHPLEGCRRGAGKLQAALSERWPDDAEQPVGRLADLQICPGAQFKGWRSCRAASPEQRGYTCGLWLLFHSLAARLPDSENAGAVWLAAVRGYVGNYFQCTDCAKHFMKLAAGEEALAVATKRDAVLWLWRTHNSVNQRLRAEGGDNTPLHTPFPPPELCSRCRSPGGGEAAPWDEDHVYAFLLAHYGGEVQALASVSGTAAGLRARHSGWGDAALLVALVAGCVYAVLRRSAQYALRKSESRLL